MILYVHLGDECFRIVVDDDKPVSHLAALAAGISGKSQIWLSCFPDGAPI